jgi:hypothetical protein
MQMQELGDGSFKVWAKLPINHEWPQHIEDLICDNPDCQAYYDRNSLMTVLTFTDRKKAEQMLLILSLVFPR